MNWILASGNDLSSLRRNWTNAGNITEFSKNIFHILFLTIERAGHWIRRCSKVPMVSGQVPAWQSPPELLDQCLVRYSDQKRPETILARIVTFLHSKALLVADVQIP